ncbi:MAG: glycosyltransferase family 2 protein [Desulfobacterales bacterium]|nr:glycosyltransferase family 2 protein [Desulfobacterales bacterium]
MNKLTIVFGYKDRGIHRIKRCFESLKAQTLNDFNVVLIDYGSDEYYSAKIQALCSQYPFINYRFNNTRGMPWNRSHALNSGIKIATGKYILLGDIDLIYSSNFITSFYKKLNSDIQFYKPVYWLPEFFEDWSNLNQHLTTFPHSGFSGKGGVHIIKKDILLKIKGFDEFYCFWGVEDRDLNARTEALGIKTEWLSLEDAPVYHQWHPFVSNTRKDFFPDKWWDDMNIYYALNINNVKRNASGWGYIYETEDRVSLRNLKKSNFKKIIEIPEEGNSYTKAHIITKIINNFKRLSESESILIKIPSIQTEKNEDFKLRVVKTILSKISANITVYNKVKLNRLENSQYYFIPRNDVMYLIWSLIRKHNIVRDYYIVEDNLNFQIVISK